MRQHDTRIHEEQGQLHFIKKAPLSSSRATAIYGHALYLLQAQQMLLISFLSVDGGIGWICHTGTGIELIRWIIGRAPERTWTDAKIRGD